MPPVEDHVRGAGGGLFNKIKRYSNVSHKLMRRANNTSHHNQSVPRKHSPHRSSCGSYDMTGDSSRDLRPEIGAPVLITTTALDIEKITPILEHDSTPKSVIPASSSDSDTDVFADASATIKDFGNIKFSFFENGKLPGIPNQNRPEFNLSTSTEEGDYEVMPIRRDIPHNFSLPLHEDSSTTPSPDPPPMRKNKSKSVSNLFTPRKLEVAQVRHPVSSVDLPALAYEDDEHSGYYNEPAADYDDSSDKENSGGGATCNNNIKARSWNANTVIEEEEVVPVTKQQDQEFNDFKRSLSAIILHQSKVCDDVVVHPPKTLEKSVVFQDSKDNDDNVSHKSFSSVSSDFDLKSASFEDLQQNRNLFLSIDELNALTKEIHESEEFNNSITMIDQEYCDHRSNLRPNQRRVTLMRNKPNKIQLNLNDKKEKITNVWSGFKHWIDEERGKIKEVVQRHSAMQRVGAHLKSPNKAAAQGGGVDEEAGEVSSPRNKSRSFAENEEESTDDLDIATATADCNVAAAQRDSRRSEDRSDLFHTMLRQKSKTSTASAAASGTAEVIICITIAINLWRMKRWRLCIVLSSYVCNGLYFRSVTGNG